MHRIFCMQYFATFFLIVCNSECNSNEIVLYRNFARVLWTSIVSFGTRWYSRTSRTAYYTPSSCNSHSLSMVQRMDSSYVTFVVIIVIILMFPCSIAMKGCICVGLLTYLFLLLATTPNLASTISIRYVLSRFHEYPVYLETGLLILGMFVCVLYRLALAVNVHFKRPHISVFALQK